MTGLKPLEEEMAATISSQEETLDTLAQVVCEQEAVIERLRKVLPVSVE